MVKRIACAVAASACCASAQAQIGVSAPPLPGPALVMCTILELGRQVPCPDSEMFFHQGRAWVQRAFNAKDFARLDELASET